MVVGCMVWVSDQKRGGVLLCTEGTGEGAGAGRGLVWQAQRGLVLVYGTGVTCCLGFALVEWVTGMLVMFCGDFIVVGWGCLLELWLGL